MNYVVMDGSNKGITSLFLAVEGGYLEVVKLLLLYKADLDIKHPSNVSPHGVTVLYPASARGYIEISQLLLEAGADVNSKFGSDYFPLRIAVVRNDEAVLRMLLEFNSEVDLQNKDGISALNSINSSTSLSIVKILINYKANLETRNNNGQTPVYTAVYYSNFQVVEYFGQKSRD